MSTLFAALLGISLSFSGFAMLAIAMDKHYEQLCGEEEIEIGKKVLIRTLGTCALLLAVGICGEVWGAVVGLIIGACMLSCGAALAMLLLTYWSQGFIPITVTISAQTIATAIWQLSS